MLDHVKAANLDGLSGIRHAFFTRNGGVSSGIYATLNCGVGSSDDRALVAENRRRVAAAMGVAADCLLTPYQIHSAGVVLVETPWVAGPDAPRADAVVTAKPGLAIGVSTADCAPVLFADPQARVVAAAHAGWRGGLGGVLEATVARMEEIGAARGNIRVAIGPTISQAAYEVGAEFRDRFLAADPGYDRFFAARPGDRPHFDLPGFLHARLRAAGLSDTLDLALCTCADEGRWFSYRRTTHRGEADYGRQLSVIAIEP